MPVVVRNPSQLEEFTVPTREDGGFYRFEMVCGGGTLRLYADDTGDLLNYLIPGYADMDVAAQLSARIRHAVDQQVKLQARLNAFFAASDRTEAEDDILSSPRHIQPTVRQWDCQVPLVLVDAFYEPYTDTPRPFSGIADHAIPPNIWWITPVASNLDYLRSLHQTSLIDLNIARDDVI